MSGARKPGQRATPAGDPGGMQLFDRDGRRKYLTVAERVRFLRAARTLCMTLAWSGCRLSEALALTADRVDLAGGVLVFATLKKRQDGIYRAVPVPPPCSRPWIWCMAFARRSTGGERPSGCGPGRA